jgi:hypothetical protein
MEFQGASGLIILNRGNEPTFCNGYRSEVIDITLGSLGLLDNIKNWEVSMEPSLLGHGYILFTLRGSLPVRLSRDPRGTKWDSFREELRDSMSRGPIEYIRDEAGLGLALQWLQHALLELIAGWETSTRDDGGISGTPSGGSRVDLRAHSKHQE